MNTSPTNGSSNNSLPWNNAIKMMIFVVTIQLVCYFTFLDNLPSSSLVLLFGGQLLAFSLLFILIIRRKPILNKAAEKFINILLSVIYSVVLSSITLIIIYDEFAEINFFNAYGIPNYVKYILHVCCCLGIGTTLKWRKHQLPYKEKLNFIFSFAITYFFISAIMDTLFVNQTPEYIYDLMFDFEMNVTHFVTAFLSTTVIILKILSSLLYIIATLGIILFFAHKPTNNKTSDADS